MKFRVEGWTNPTVETVRMRMMVTCMRICHPGVKSAGERE